MEGVDDAEMGFCFDPALLVPGRLLPGYRIVGERPETFTLGYRWSAPDNMFSNAGIVGMEEWKKVNASINEESDERKLRQFTWALPTDELNDATLTVSASAIRRRMGRLRRGMVPTDWNVSAFLDLGKRVCHWAVVAGLDRYQIVDTGVVEVPSGDRSTEEGIRIALWEFYDRVMEGWGEPRQRPGIALVDSGKWSSVVYPFIREVSQMNTGVMWFATKGHGVSQSQAKVYLTPEKRNEIVRYIGDQYHLRLQEAHRIYLLHMDADTWKTRVHNALSTEMGEPGSLVLWSDDTDATDVWTLSKHLTAERGVEKFDPKKGTVTVWERANANNHLLDCTYGCFVGLHYLRVVLEAKKGAVPPAPAGTGKGAGVGAGAGPFRWTRE